ncbi:ABC transporter substrate-binding protein [Desulfobacterales bacterium HSG17]|nr:ABC transporter substrate-binding protein [Desulfobacterales bacterium HSG17]
MKKSFRINLIVLACSFIFLIINAHSKEPVQIGLSAPLTGKFSGYGNNFQKAIDLAIESINKTGGIDGRPLELIVRDSEGMPTKAKRIAREFGKNHQIAAVIGNFSSSSSMAARPIYDRNTLVQLSPTSSHPAYASGSPYSFEIIGTQDGESLFMAKQAVSVFGKKKLGVLFMNNDWGIASQKFFVDEAKRLGAEIVALESFFAETKDFKPVLEKIYKAKPEVLFIPSMYNTAALILKEKKKLGWNDLIVMSPKSLYNPKLIELGSDAVEGIYINAIFFPEDPRAEVQKFAKAYEGKYGQAPDMFAALAYDCVYLLAQAIKQAGTDDRKAIRDALAGIKDFSGVVGKIQFTEHGDVKRETFLLQVKNGEFVLFSGK